MNHHKLLIDEPPLQVLPTLAKEIGLNEAIVLQQIHYLLRGFGKERDGNLWVYNTYEQWQEYFPFWSVSTIRRILTKLETDGLIEAGNYNKLGFDNTKWYALVYSRLTKSTDDLFKLSRRPAQFEQVDAPNMNRPIPKTTPKTTTGISFSDEKGTPKPTRKARKPKADKPVENPEHQEMFGALCTLVGWDFKTLTKEQIGQVAQTLGVIEKAGYTLVSLKAFYLHWYNHDWRGKKKQTPTLSQVRAEIGNVNPAIANGDGVVEADPVFEVAKQTENLWD